MTAWEAMRIERDERALGHAAWLSGTADISAADAEWRRSTGARNVVHVPPFALDLGPAGATAAPPGSQVSAVSSGPAVPDDGVPRVLFLGSLDISTNTDGNGQFQLGYPREVMLTLNVEF